MYGSQSKRKQRQTYVASLEESEEVREKKRTKNKKLITRTKEAGAYSKNRQSRNNKYSNKKNAITDPIKHYK